MTDAAPRPDALRRTLTVGGVLLIVSAIVGFAAPATLGLAGVGVVLWAGPLAFSAALVVFGVGLGRSGSLVARRPIGMASAVILAVRPFADGLAAWVVPFSAADVEFHRVWNDLSMTVALAAGIVLVVQIARAGVVTGPLRWAPAWALAAVASPLLLTEVLIRGNLVDMGVGDGGGLVVLAVFNAVVTFAAPLVLGILSLLRAGRPLPDRPAVQVYPPAPDA